MIIDTHFHAFPAKFLEMVPDASRGDPRGVGFHPYSDVEYIGHLDRHGIDIGVLSHPGGGIEAGFNRQRALDLCVACNDAYADYCSRHPKRLKWFAMMLWGGIGLVQTPPAHFPK